MESHPLDFEKPILELQRRLQDLKDHSDRHDLDFDSEVEAMENKLRETRRQIYDNLTAWQRVQLARHILRPFALDYVSRCFTDWVELHGDRLFGDDKAMPSGLAKLGPHRCVVITNQKGRDTKENVRRNFGCAHPEGYRKALRAMKLAAKFRLPVICLIDTPGAFPGIGAEERGQAQLIAVNLMEMARLETPIVCVVIGEGGSGGALGIGVGDRVSMLEHAYYSVISPEGCAGILWREANDTTKPLAAEALKLTAKHLHRLGVIDEVIPEPLGGAHRDHREMANTLKAFLVRSIRELRGLPGSDLLELRYQKFRAMGVFQTLAAGGDPLTNGEAISP